MNVCHEQYVFFRRYNLQDSATVMLNLILLFVALFYVYPLKFLFTLLVNQWFGFGTQVHLAGGAVENAIERGQVGHLMAIFSGGYLAVSCVFLLLFGRALEQRAELELNALEVFETRVSVGAAVMNASVALISLVIALTGGIWSGSLAGIIYPILLAPGFTIFYGLMGRRRRKLGLAVHGQG